ncbi:glycoside hydrolase family 127 protein [Paenibacillus sp. LHD-117]|uniref:beta-L-arabinofuranosidase domain-containing protein n=1 Tax=Paenibacillus sp. LHD-117 TaxID=3071412 RepID=UPI0027DFF086|nr:beta-L-arabinofuranosidase domain-containing protein [Paenibacillus sp. LHD-117]MDQ6417881.1 glycoside hydrolase family 127 protein [Paenibacillus sp. LHD-117]
MKQVSKRSLKKTAIAALIFTLIANGVVVTGTLQAADLEAAKELDLRFEDSIADSSANGIQGTLNGTATYIEGKVGKALQLNGTNNYIDLGTSSVLQPENLTVSFWIKPDESLSGEHMLMWNKPSGSWNGEGWYLSILSDEVPLKLSTGTGVQESYVIGNRGEFFPVGEWTHVAVTYDQATKDVAIYRNGITQDVLYTSKTGSIASNDSDHKYLGFNSPGYGGGYAKLNLDEFKIYSTDISMEEIRTLYQDDGGAIDESALANLDLNSITLPEFVRVSLPLPTRGTNGSTIVWTSSNTAVLSNTGEVFEPEEDTVVTLNAAVTYGAVTLSRSFELTIKSNSPINDFAPIQPFDMEDVEVTDPFYVNAFNKNVDYLLSLDPDRLMAGFRTVAGLPKKAELYGGWEGEWSYLRGHTMGHYLTALSQAYKQTKGNPIVNQQLKTKIDYLVSELKIAQEASPNGYLFATPETHFDVIEGKAEGPSWVPWYTMHKIVAGLVDVYRYAENDTALEIADELGDWTYNRTQTWDEAIHTRVLNIEYGGMNDGLYELYKVTQEPTHLIAAHMFDEDSLFTPIVNETDVLQNKHANTQIVKFIGALNRYRTVGETETFYLEAAENFWEMVVHDHTYVTGGNSENEHFREPGLLDAHRNNVNAETCNTYNMLKLTRELFRLTGDVKYADYYERALKNEIMASMDPETGMTTYFKPMGTGYFKLYGTEFESFWCDTGTGMESFSKLDDSLYFHTESDLYVNTYVSSILEWRAKGLKLTQQADLPASDKVTFTIHAASGENVNFKFRSPDWVAEGKQVNVSVNGNVVNETVIDGYVNVERAWVAGDIVEVTFPMEVKVSALKDNEEAVAFTYGPVVLSAGMGSEQMVSVPHLAVQKAHIPEGLSFKDYILIEEGTVEEWMSNVKNNLVKTEGKVEFTLRNTDEDDNLIFTPYYLNTGERYGIYFYLSALDSPFFQNNILNKKNTARKEVALIDEVQVTNDQHELAHNLQGNSSGGSYGGYQYRHASGANTGEGWLSYDLAVNPAITNYVSTKYYSGDAGRTFNVYVDGALIQEVTVEAKTPAQFYDVRYAIPAHLVAGKSKVTVKFANRGNSFMGGLFGTVSIMKDYSTNADLQSVTIGNTVATVHDREWTISVPHNAEEGMVRFKPVNANALVYVDDILIDDTIERKIPLSADITTLNIRVVAEDRETENTYTLSIKKSQDDTSEPGGGIPTPNNSNQIDAQDDVIMAVADGKTVIKGIASKSTRDGQSLVTVKFDEKSLTKSLEETPQGTVLTVPIHIDSDISIATIPGQSLKLMEEKGIKLELRSKKGTYTLPTELLDVSMIVNQSGLSNTLADVYLQVEIGSPSEEKVEWVDELMNGNELSLIAPPVEFKVGIVIGEKFFELSEFIGYVERSIALPNRTDKKDIITGIVIEPDGSIRHVPTTVVNQDGKYYANIKSLSNSLYAVVHNETSFNDSAAHWAKNAILELGSRKIIGGNENGEYRPDDDITRAEFAAILVRALGLRLEAGATLFTDVQAADWYGSAIKTAHAYGLISGYEDGSFRPMNKITREQAMTILARAMKLTGLWDNTDHQSADSVLRTFQDSRSISDWAKEEIAANVQTGIVSGKNENTLAPKDLITRAEVAIVVMRLLKSSDFI